MATTRSTISRRRALKTAAAAAFGGGAALLKSRDIGRSGAGHPRSHQRSGRTKVQSLRQVQHGESAGSPGTDGPSHRWTAAGDPVRKPPRPATPASTRS